MADTRFMMESWRGRYSDSPRSVSEALATAWPSARRLWVTAGAAADFPADVSTVTRHSPAYFARLLTTDVLMANDIISRHLVKGPGVTYVQMWHGTPLKLIGHDERALAYAGASAHRKRMDRDVARWDALVSPSAACSTMFRSAFHYEGPIWETGYPRNDVLSSPAAPRLRAEVRDRLGIGPDDFTVLHAPTWRDDEKNAEGQFQLAAAPDPARLRRALPPSSRLLVRAHKNVTAPWSTSDSDFVQDVSAWPEISELYLAADALVSDYSSAVYDFAVTRKPIVLYVPDLDRYRDDVRGFYFDYEEWAPGPVARTPEELAEHLRAAADRGPMAVTGPDYARFVERFCPHEDGHASDRVISAVRTLLGA